MIAAHRQLGAPQMLTDPVCPVCGASSWKAIQHFVYQRGDHERPSTRTELMRRRLLDYARILVYNAPRPRRVTIRDLSSKERRCRTAFFESWFPSRDDVQLTSIACTACGFMCYRPRPTADDIRRKYEFYNGAGWDIGGQTGHSEYALRSDLQRASRIYALTTGHLGAERLSVLDYGGGNGKLLVPFRDNGHSCSIVDYSNNILPGITKIGDDSDNMDKSSRFDLIIISHVLEHVSDPKPLLRTLKQLLKPDGIVYGEVPMEIWAGIRIGPDPLTHVNFFSPDSFASLFRNAGLRPVRQRTVPGTYGASGLVVSWVIATADDVQPQRTRLGPPVEDLYPGRLYSLLRVLRQIVLPKLRSRLPSLSR